MLVIWDRDHRQLRLRSGELVGLMRNSSDFEARRRDVDDVTFENWTHIFRTARLSNGDEFHPVIVDQTKFVLINELNEDTIQVSVHTQGPEWELQSVESIIKTICESTGDTLIETIYEEGSWIFRVACMADDRTTNHIFALRDVCANLLKLPDHPQPTGDLKADAAYQILVAGGARMLIGVTESSWLEVKSRGYDLNSFGEQVELAQDVARFANGPESGLLVLGFRTARRDGKDRIVKVTPLQLPDNTPARYREVLDRRIYPPIAGLSITSVSVDSGKLLVIGIPRQVESAKPYLVHGVVVDGKNEGSFVSIIQRRDEESKPMSPAEIHALLSAGRSVLRGIV